MAFSERQASPVKPAGNNAQLLARLSQQDQAAYFAFVTGRSRPAYADPDGGYGSDRRRRNRPGMLRKSRAFVPRYRKFESISLQRGVVQTIGSSAVEPTSLIPGRSVEAQ